MGADTGDDEIIISGIQIQFFHFKARLPVFHVADVCIQRCDVPLTGSSVVRMGRWATTDVFFTQPIAGVVTRMKPGQAEVGYLVMLVSGFGKPLYQCAEELEANIFIGFLYLMLFLQLPQCGAFFINEVVGRDVFGAKLKCLTQIVLPSVEGFTGEAVHQVDADVVETGFAATVVSLDGL